MRDPQGLRRSRTGPGPGRVRPGGFTLVELLIVMVIIGIIIAFILTAAMGGVRRAEERATQGLISKLETGLADRLESLLASQQNPTDAHATMATIWTGAVLTPPALPSRQRAQVIANIDHIKAEMPDVFYIPTTGDPDFSLDYPINFAGAAFGPRGNGNEASYTLPYDLPAYPIPNRSQVTGFFGASITVRGALCKNLNPGGNNPLGPRAYDLIDNDGDSKVDESDEGWTAAILDAFRTTHKQKTARSEVLYAILVEGQGPFGSVFERDDFTDREVQDTDNDGLPEFVDAWGEPLQFYRWPIFYHSDLQRGFVPRLTAAGPDIPPYTSVFEPREQNPLDPNQLLMAPSWWGTFNYGPIAAPGGAPYGGGVAAFQSLFFSLVEPYARNNTTGPALAPFYWDRSGGARRAFYSKFLIASSGLDRELGIARLDVFGINPTVPALMVESQARQTDLNVVNMIYSFPANLNYPWQDLGMEGTLLEAGGDDITNHNYQAPGGVVQ